MMSEKKATSKSSSKSSSNGATKGTAKKSTAKKSTTKKTTETIIEDSITGVLKGNAGGVIEEITSNAKEHFLDEVESKTTGVKDALLSGKGLDGIKEVFFHEEKKTTVESGESDAQQLRELKSLLDDGIITKAEFDAKKKKLLGI